MRRQPGDSSSLISNTLWAAGGFGLRLGVQLFYFILVARLLGPKDYGAFAATLAIVSILFPFASWGSGNILIKQVSRDRTLFPLYWGAALATTLLVGTLLTAIAALVTTLLFGWERGLELALPLALGDLIGLKLTDISAQAFQAHQRLSRTAGVWLTTSGLRLAAAASLLALPIEPSAYNWALLYALSGLLAGVLSAWQVNRAFGSGPLTLKPMRGAWLEGFYFASGLAAQGAYNDIDKTLLSRLVSDEVSGTYTAAYRVLDAGFTPIKALLYASYPKFFQKGASGLKGARSLALKLVPWGLAASLVAALSLAVASPLIPLLLGEKYRSASQILVLLAPILIFRTLHYFAADALTGGGYQGLRTAVQAGIGGLNLLLNLWLIPLLSWRGAVISSLISDAGLALTLWWLLSLLARREEGDSRERGK